MYHREPVTELNVSLTGKIFDKMDRMKKKRGSLASPVKSIQKSGYYSA